MVEAINWDENFYLEGGLTNCGCEIYVITIDVVVLLGLLKTLRLVGI